MTPAAAAKLIDEGRAMLSRERALLIEGRYDELMQLAEARERALAALTGAAPETLSPLRKRLAGLKAAAERNAALLTAAIEGVGAARKRIAAARQARAGLSSYDASGAPVEQSFNRPTGRRA